MRLTLLAAAAVALFACSSEEKLNPVGVPDAGSQGGAGGGDAGPGADAGVVKRTVMTRSPLGDVPNNLLADGDFELSSSRDGNGQYAWRAFTLAGQPLAVETETGGLCKSGLKCASMSSGEAYFLRGVAASQAKGHVGSAWVKVPAGAKCSVVGSSIVRCYDLVIIGGFTPDDKTPGDGGWCHYTLSLPPQDHALCVYTQNALKKGETAIVDAITLAPDDGTVHPESAPLFTPSPEIVAQLDALRGAILTPPPRPWIPKQIEVK